MKCTQLKSREKFLGLLSASLFSLLLIGFYLSPLLKNLNFQGRGDWDQMYFYHEVPQKTLLVYHQFPFWNPYYCGGMTLIGNPQNRLFSPAAIINLVAGVVPGLKIDVLFHLMIGALGMFYLARFWGLQGVNAFLPVFLFVLNGKLALHVTEGHFWILTIVYLPFLYLSFLKSFKSFINVSASGSVLRKGESHSLPFGPGMTVRLFPVSRSCISTNWE